MWLEHLNDDQHPFDAGPKVVDEQAMLDAKEIVTIAADEGFRTLPPSCPKLLAVVFEAWGSDIDSIPFELCKFGFLRSSQPNFFGRTTYAARSIEPHMAKHRIPYADVLEEERFVFAWKTGAC